MRQFVKKGGQSASVQSFLCEHRWAVIVICLPLSAHRSGGQLTADTLTFKVSAAKKQDLTVTPQWGSYSGEATVKKNSILTSE